MSAAVAAIQYALEDDDGIDFLRYWNQGEFDVLRRNWENIPEEVFIGADPLHPKTAIADRPPLSKEVIRESMAKHVDCSFEQGLAFARDIERLCSSI